MTKTQLAIAIVDHDRNYMCFVNADESRTRSINSWKRKSLTMVRAAARNRGLI